MKNFPRWTITDSNNERVTNQPIAVIAHTDIFVESAEEAEAQAIRDKKIYPELLYVYIPASKLCGYFRTEFYEKANKKTSFVTDEESKNE